MQASDNGDMRRATARFAVSALLSLVIVAAGLIWAWRIGLRANFLDHRLDHMQHAIIADGDHHDEEEHR